MNDTTDRTNTIHRNASAAGASATAAIVADAEIDERPDPRVKHLIDAVESLSVLGELVAAELVELHRRVDELAAGGADELDELRRRLAAAEHVATQARIDADAAAVVAASIARR